MKILHVVNSMGRGGAERQLSNLLGPLTNLGVQNYIATLLPEQAYDDRVIPYVTQYEVGLLQSGWIAAFPKLVHLAGRVDVVHTQLPWSDVVGRLAALAARRPAFSTLQSTWYNHQNMQRLPPAARQRARVVKALDAVTARAARRLFAVSEATRDVYIRELKIPGDRIGIIPNAVDLTEFDPSRLGRRDAVRAALGFSADSLAVLVVARFHQQKDHATAIAAVARAARQRPMHLYLVGTGPLEEHLRALARELDAPVSFLGLRDDVPSLLFASDLFLLPTFFEGLSVALIEAMAMGLPCICSNIPENVEAGRDSVVYAPPGDVDALACRLVELADGEAMRRDLGERARKRAQSFDARAVAAQFLRAIQSAL